MIKGKVKTDYYWGLTKDQICYIDLSGKVASNAIGVYDAEKRFIAYTFDRETLEECVEFGGIYEERKEKQLRFSV